MTTYNPHHIETHDFFRVGIKAVVSDDQGRILLLRRSDKVSRAHGWDLPGGGLNAGEQPWEALARELHEETGLHIQSSRLEGAVIVPANNGDPTLVMGYMATAAPGEVKLSWEHEAYQWVQPQVAVVADYDLPRLHKHLVDLYIENR